MGRAPGSLFTVSLLLAESFCPSVPAVGSSNAEFAITELSLSLTVMVLSHGACTHAPIPVFPSRSFRHARICVRGSSGFEQSSGLKGHRVAIPEYGVLPRDVRRMPTGRENEIGLQPRAGVTIEKLLDRSVVDLFAPQSLASFKV